MDKERLFRYLDRKYSSKNEIIPHIPLGEDADAIWTEVLQDRRERGITLPLINLNGENYWYILTNKMIAASEVIVEELMEQNCSAEPHNSSVSTIEEIYYTGFMEGAQISVQDAMRFLQSGEEPENVEELILLNSRQAAGFAAESMYHAIDSNYLHNLAYFLTEGLDNGSGDFRVTDTIEIPSLQGESVQLPPAGMIPEQTERLTAFLADTMTHPLIKAAAAQAWVLAYRPFPEGNERLARLLSNVILIRAGYCFFGEISISSIIARTSYEYFRAIANTLRTENGADLTYFLEYYLVSLSAAVNEMKTRRIQKAEKVVESEQKLAASPLQEPETHHAAQHEAPPILFSNREERIETVGAGLDQLMAQGYEQFTLGDLSAVTGINRKYLSKLIRPYEKSERIFAVRRSKTGNIYAFKQSAPDEDDAQEELVQQKRPDIDTGHSQYVISASEKRNDAEQDAPAAIPPGETRKDGYSDAVMNTIAMLEQSEYSPKDRRIARIIRSCLAKGTVTKDDYSAEGELTKWKADVRFAEQLGLLEKVSSSEYRIAKEMGDAYSKLRAAQKCTLSALYDIFGDGMFSAEMVVAQLDYSSSHVSGILHQFTMLKLLECKANDNNSYSYQLNVNPADNPECFGDVA